MFKKSPSRNQRSKGIKTKHVLQICLLLGVCFWLIYQVKHSHDKRKEFDEKDAKASVKTENDDVILKFGRKDLPRLQEVSKNYKHEEEEEEENVLEEENKHGEELEEKPKRLEEEEQEGASKHEEGEQEEGSKHEEEEQEEASKHEEEEQEEASKHEEEEQEEVREDEGSKHDDEEQEAEIKDEETEDEGRGDGDDEVDENEQEKADGEADREEEFLDEEKERETEGEDKENEEKENEEKEGQEDSENLENDQNHDGGGRNAHEAREEHYKADDASSAVSHDTQINNSVGDKLDIENSNDNSTMNVLEESKSNTTQEINGDENKTELKVDEGKTSGGGSSLNETYKENDHQTGSSSLPNTTTTTDINDQASNNSSEANQETGSKPAEVNIEVPGSLQNETATELKLTSAQNTTEDGTVTGENYKEQANETISNSEQHGSNALDSSRTDGDSATKESSTNEESDKSEDVAKINELAGGDGSGFSMIQQITDSTQNEKSDGGNESGRTDEGSDTSSSTETVDEIQHDPFDSSDNTLPQEEEDARVDLGTLPDIRTEGSDNEDTAAE